MTEPREPLMDKEYFEEEISYEISTIEEFKQDLIEIKNPNPKDLASFLHSIFIKSFELTILKYSNGDDVEEITKPFKEALEEFFTYIEFKESEKFNFKKDLDDYIVSLWLVSLAIMLKVDDKLFQRLLDCIGNEGEDVLFEKLVSTRLNGRKTASKLIYKKQYNILLAAIDKSGNQEENIKKFLKIWYPSMKNAYWHDNHKGPEGGGFFGYWCWEAAAVSYAFDVNDASFKDMPYYPKDMANYAKI